VSVRDDQFHRNPGCHDNTEARQRTIWGDHIISHHPFRWEVQNLVE
jgi:hypothetical protein